MKQFVSVVAGVLLTIPFSAVAGDPAAGKAKAGTCFTCHGADGIGIVDMYPNLAGQKETYLVSSIKAYKDGSRTGGMASLMTPMVGGLSDADIADIAAFYASLSPK
ncbi:MAG: cytochrome c [Pseudomonadales bacterium]